MSSHGTPAAHLTLSARAAASRANGAKSKGPTTALGKARSAQNALKHGLCARKHVLLPDDSRAEFKALEGALLEDLRPEGALQTLLAHRLVAAAWRLARADRLEFGLLIGGDPRESPGRALVRDGRAAAAFATLVRYRGGAQAELFRTLKALKELQAAAAAADRAADAMPPEPPVAGTPEPRPGVAALRLPAERPALPPLGEVARPRVPIEAERAAPGASPMPMRRATNPSGPEVVTDAPPMRRETNPSVRGIRNRQGLAAVSCWLPVDR